jgi:hypothetical protein
MQARKQLHSTRSSYSSYHRGRCPVTAFSFTFHDNYHMDHAYATSILELCSHMRGLVRLDLNLFSHDNVGKAISNALCKLLVLANTYIHHGSRLFLILVPQREGAIAEGKALSGGECELQGLCSARSWQPHTDRQKRTRNK